MITNPLRGTPDLERVTRAYPCIDPDHQYIHERMFFEAFYRFTLATTITGNIIIITPPLKYVHYRSELVSSSADKVTIEFFEAPTVTDNGTEITPNNHNRISRKPATVRVFHTATVSADGLKLAQNYVGGGTNVGANRSGDSIGEKHEWTLKRGTIYMVKITNGSLGDNIIQVNPTWYEEGDA